MGVTGAGSGPGRGLALGLLAAAGPLLILSHVWDHPVARLTLVVLVMSLPSVLIRLGLRRSSPGVRAFLGGLAVLLVGSGVALLALPAPSPTLLGVAASLLLMLAGLWLLPLLLVVWVYATTFSRWALSADDLDRLRRRHPGLRDAPH